jgi:hypothetical protein
VTEIGFTLFNKGGLCPRKFGGVDLATYARERYKFLPAPFTLKTYETKNAD